MDTHKKSTEGTRKNKLEVQAQMSKHEIMPEVNDKHSESLSETQENLNFGGH